MLDERIVSAPSVLATRFQYYNSLVHLIAHSQLSTMLPVLLTRICENSTWWEYMIDMVLETLSLATNYGQGTKHIGTYHIWLRKKVIPLTTEF